MKGIVIMLAFLLTVSFALPSQRLKRATQTSTEETPKKDVSKEESQEEKPVISSKQEEDDETRRPLPISPAEYGVYQYQYRTPPEYLPPVSQLQHPGPRPQYCCQHPVNCQRERPPQYFYPFPAYFPQAQPAYMRQPVPYLDDPTRLDEEGISEVGRPVFNKRQARQYQRVEKFMPTYTY